jgi:two-component system LytT family sensor kinase
MKRIIVVLLHIGYWMIFLLLLAFIFALILSATNKNSLVHLQPGIFRSWTLLMSGFAVIPGAISFYSFYNILFNRYFVKRKILPFLLSGLLIIAIAACAGDLFLSFIFGHLGVVFAGTIRATMEVFTVMAFGALLNGIIGLVMKGFITSYGDIRVKEELNRKNYEIELDLVKAQLSPHFLFNTINNIDVLIGIDAVKASEYLNKLSDIMRFMLYEAKTELIPLDKELLYIEKYIALQRIRTANPDYIKYTVKGNSNGLNVPPMLFIPFIENAFKHALHQKTGAGIHIAVQIEKDKIIFDCSNRFAPAQTVALQSGGLGNELMRKRLELLYPGKHRLVITREQDTYILKLELDNI